MKIDFAFLCDFAQAAGKINALGIGFDTLYVPQVPAKHSHFSLVIQLRASIVESGEKKIQVNLIDEDGKDLLPAVQGQFNLPRKVGAPESIGRFVMEFGNVEFKRYGPHSVRVVIEGMEMASISFRVMPPPPKTGA